MEYAYIERVTLQNFMCHTHFEIALNPSLNVVIGTNGSGKSSILTAIMVALGSRARSTSRGETLGSLVQTGKERAWVHLDVRVPELGFSALYARFGARVRITRVIDASGTSRYELRDATNRVVKGAGAADVQSVCHHVGLFPDNELAMLSQESAKEFLVSATAKLKYEKLRRALQQHVIARDKDAIRAAQQQQHALVERIKVRKQNLDETEREADKVLQQHALAASFETRLRVLKKDLARRALAKLEEAHADATRQAAAADAALADAHDPAVFAARISDEEAALASMQDALATAADRLHAAEGELRVREDELASSARELKRLEKDCARLEAEMHAKERALTAAVAARDAADPRAVVARQTALRAAVDAAAREAEDAGQRAEEARRAVDDLQNGIDAARTTLRDLQHEERDVEQRIAGLGQRQGASHKPEIANLLKLVHASRAKFNVPPVGPLYDQFKLGASGAAFAGALEALWNATLDSWWVRTDHDRQLLGRLAAQTRANIRIILRQDDAFSVSQVVPPPSPKYRRVVDTVAFASPAVERVFVDLCHVESSVFAESIAGAFDACRHPRVRSAIAKNTKGDGFTLVTATLGRTESSVITPMSLGRVNIEASEAQRRQQELDARERFNAEQRRLRAEAEREKATLEQLQSQKRAAAVRARELAEQAQRAQARGAQAETELDTMLELSVADLEGRVRDAELELKSAKQDFTELLEALHVLEPPHADLQARAADLHDSVVALSRERMHASADARACEDRIAQLHNDAAQAAVRRQRALTRRDTAHADLSVAQEELAKEQTAFGDEFGDVSDALFEGELAQYTVHKVRQLLEQHISSEQALREIAQLVEKARADKARVQRVRREIQASEDELQRLSKLVEQRRRERAQNEHVAWESVKQRIRTTYLRILRRRNFHGGVEIDDEHSRLVATAAPDAEEDLQSGEKTRAMSTLSGGEKSFTQIALLMAVWESMQVGFVSMDEYDVFMDKANRTLSLRVLAETVDRRKMQCLLITPQPIETSVLENVNYEVFKLAPARAASS